MTPRLVVRPAALQDLREARDWYEAQRLASATHSAKSSQQRSSESVLTRTRFPKSSAASGAPSWIAFHTASSIGNFPTSSKCSRSSITVAIRRSGVAGLPHNDRHEQTADLRRAVLAAFDGVTCPPASEIVAPCDCDECAALQTAFAGADWRAVPAATIEKRCDALPLFSPEAYPYFLGAWLLYSLDHFAKDVSAIEFLVYDLAPSVPDPDDLDRIEGERQQLRSVTREQLDVTARFLDMVDEHPELAAYFGDVARGRAHYRESWERRRDS